MSENISSVTTHEKKQKNYRNKDELDPELQDLFYIDRKPDKDNLLFESNYKVPIYKSLFSGDNFKSRPSKELRYFHKQNKIPTDGSDKTSEGVKKNDVVVDAEVEWKDEVDEKTKSFNENLSKHPNNVDLWLRFVEFQDEKFLKEMKLKDLRNPSDKKVLNEIKLSVVEEALKKNPHNVSLSLLRLELGEMLWEREKVESSWRELISRGKQDTKLWRHYVEYIGKHFGTFSVEKLLQMYRECFKSLRIKIDRNAELVADLMAFLWEVIDFLDCSGHSEMCTALFQLMVELNTDPPSSVQGLPFSDVLDFLSAFWSSTCPKFGEDGWLGWGRWVDQGGVAGKEFVEPWFKRDFDEEREYKLIEVNCGNGRTACWLDIEKYRSGQHWCSWRPEKGDDDDDDEGCEDEDRVVHFEEVSDFLFFVNTGDVDRLRFEVVWKFLDYLTRHSKDACVGDDTMYDNDVDDWNRAVYKNLMTDCGDFVLTSDFTHADKMFANVVQSSLKMFGDERKRLLLHRLVGREIHVVSCDRSRPSKTRQKELREFFKKTLKDNGDDIILWVKYARFEKACGRTEQARKVLETTLASQKCDEFSRYVVKRYQLDVEYNIGCSMICEGCSIWAGGNDDVTAAAVGNEKEDANKFVNLFQWLLDAPSSGTSSILKVKRLLENRIDETIENFSLRTNPNLIASALYFFSHDLLHVTHMLAHFLLAATSSPDDSLAVYAKASTKLLSRARDFPSLEKPVKLLCRHLLRDRQCFLAHCQQKHQFISSRIVASVTTEDLKRFPSDAFAVKKYFDLKNDPADKWRHEVLSLIHGENRLVCLKVHYLASLFKKFREMKDTGFQTESLINKIHNFLELCVGDEKTRKSPLVWSLYLFFHNTTGRKEERSTATNKFYRVIESLPGCKALYLQSISYSKDMLPKITKIMNGKGIRLRTFTEEIDLLVASHKILSSTNTT